MIDTRLADRAIDSVARSMTEIALPEDFSARVLAALPAQRAPRPSHPWRLAIASVGVVAAATVFLAWPITTSLPSLPSRPVAAGAAIAAAIPSSAIAEDAVVLTVATRAAAAPHRESTTTIYRLPALTRPSALAVAPIQPENVAIGLLELKPMATEPLAIPRVDPRGGSE